MKIDPRPPADWKGLQTQVARILSECGLNAEFNKPVTLVRGTVNVDVYAVDSNNIPPGVYVCERKNWGSNVPKEQVHAFRSVVADSGANHGFMISSHGFQSGAYEAARLSNIQLLTWDEFDVAWQKRWIEKCLKQRFRDASDKISDYLDPIGSRALGRRMDRLSAKDREEFVKLHFDAETSAVPDIAVTYGGLMDFASYKLTLPFQVRDPNHFPEDILTTESLREFCDMVCDAAEKLYHRFEEILSRGADSSS